MKSVGRLLTVKGEIPLGRGGPALGRMVPGTGVEEPERQRGIPGRGTPSGGTEGGKWHG